MLVKNSMKLLICFCMVSFLVLSLYHSIHPQSGKEIAFSGDFKPYFANDRIVVKLYSEIDKTKVGSEKGIVITGLRSLDNLNARFKVNVITQLFPGSTIQPQAVEHGLPRIYRLEFPAVPDVREVVKTYARDPNIEYA